MNIYTKLKEDKIMKDIKPNERQIIDFIKKGNQVRFFLGTNDKQWGDSWDVESYEHNSGEVYRRFIIGSEVVSFDFDDLVVEPMYGFENSPHTKQDMVNRLIPCIIVLKDKDKDRAKIYENFNDLLVDPNSLKIYFGDDIWEVLAEYEKK